MDLKVDAGAKKNGKSGKDGKAIRDMESARVRDPCEGSG
jgi:hypothetical protein